MPYASQVFRRLNDWLAQFENPVLIAHNGFRFDAPILISSMIRYKLYDQFRARVSHFGDTLGELKAVLPDGVRSGCKNFPRNTIFLREVSAILSGIRVLKSDQGFQFEAFSSLAGQISSISEILLKYP